MKKTKEILTSTIVAGTMLLQGGIGGIPTKFIIDKNGMINLKPLDGMMIKNLRPNYQQ